LRNQPCVGGQTMLSAGGQTMVSRAILMRMGP
jgi:hypothetical protein